MNINELEELEELAKAAPAAFYLDSDDGLDREFNGIDSIPKKQAKARRYKDCKAI